MGTIADKLRRLLSTKTAIKDAIVAKGQPVTDADTFASYPEKIMAIETGVKLPVLTTPATSAQILAPYEAIDQEGAMITGSIASKSASDVTVSGATVTAPAGYYPEQVSKSVASATQATPTISVSSGGLITASATQAAGYVAAGTKSATKQLTTQAAQTITPGTSNKTIASGRYLTGTQTIKGDANLVAANIVSGKSIFGVNGTADTIKLADVTIINASVEEIHCTVLVWNEKVQKFQSSTYILLDDEIDTFECYSPFLITITSRTDYRAIDTGDGTSLTSRYIDTGITIGFLLPPGATSGQIEIIDY